LIEILKGNLLTTLTERKDVQSIELTANLEITCKLSQHSIDALPHQGGSLSGLSHIQGVLHEIENLMGSNPNLDLASVEIYILLTAILLHDIGKLKEEEAPREKKSQAANNNSTPEETNNNSKLEEIIHNLCNKLQLNENAKKVFKDIKKTHPFISALIILENYAHFGIFDKELAQIIAVVALSHCECFRKYLEKDEGFLADRYLARYGKIRVKWLAALLIIGDELDTSYHRAVYSEFLPQKNNTDATKGEFRSNIGGCKIDLTGRCIVVYPVDELKKQIQEDPQSIRNDEKSLYYIFARDIVFKNKLIQEWSSELKQMNIALQACLVEVDGDLLKVIEKDMQYQFAPVVEPTISYFKVSRVIEAMFKLKYGVFKKKYFSWEMLQSEAGFETQAQLKLVVHRLSRLAVIFSGQKDCQLFQSILGILSELTFKLEIQELSAEWTIEILPKSNDKSASNNNGNTPVISVIDISSWFLFFVESIIDFDNLDEFKNRAQLIIQNLNNAQSAIDSKKTNRFFIQPGNEQLTYLLNEISPCWKCSGHKIFTPLGIELPLAGGWYINTKFESGKKVIVYHPRLLGINMVIAGPPGIGKSTLSLDIINNLSLINCPVEVNEKCDKDLKSNGAVAYFSLEQPLFTIKNLAERMREDEKIDISILEEKFIESSESDISDENLDKNDDEYKNLINKKDTRFLLLPRLSPRFVGEKTSDDDRILFWQRFKQISRLIEASFVVTQGDPNHDQRLHAIVIDNINSFLNEPMAREYIFKLFRLISSSGILGIFILEDPEESTADIKRELEEVEFLTDIWIKLGWSHRLDYKFKMLEIKKSRYQRHVLGSHPFKIRMKEDAS
jgi:KaiC/GvpD/RAD55 family RecA-like ATPase